MNEQVLEWLKGLARRNLPDGDFNPMDASGGNFDDAYDMGVRHGEIMLAQEILIKLGISYE